MSVLQSSSCVEQDYSKFTTALDSEANPFKGKFGDNKNIPIWVKLGNPEKLQILTNK